MIGLDSMQGIQTARILSSHGIPVVGIAANPSHHCCKTNSCRQIYFANTQTEDFLQTLDRIAETAEHPPVLFPCHDQTVRILSRNRRLLENRFRFALADSDVIEMLSNKVAFYEYANAVGLAVPLTFVIRDRRDAKAAAARMTYPAILKPSARSREWDANTLVKAIKVETAEELLDKYSECSGWVGSLVVQEWIAGGDECLYSCNCYFSQAGEAVCTFVARKLRQWPPGVGVSSLGEECRNDGVLESTLEFFSGLGYKGLGYLEIKQEPGTGRQLIVEPNVGRPTGRSAIAEAGGVAMLYTMYCDLVGLPLPANRTQQYAGAKWIDLRHDFQSAFHYWRKGELSLKEWYLSVRGKKAHTYFSWTDPGPFVFDLLSVPLKLLLPSERRKRRSLERKAR